jgi:hypothetical protein
MAKPPSVDSDAYVELVVNLLAGAQWSLSLEITKGKGVTLVLDSQLVEECPTT